MIPNSFEYKRASSVQEAIGMLDGNTKLLAGGHSLIPTLKLRLSQPDSLVDISRIASLQSIREDGDNIVIGAGATHGEIARSEIIQSHCKVMADVAEEIGDIQVRNKGTIGGSLAHADPAADWPAIILAIGASIVVEGSGGKRTIHADDFFTGFYATALASGEIITEIIIPKITGGSKGVYLKFMQPASRFAVVGVAVVIPDNGNAKVAYTGIGESAFRDAAAESAISNGLTNDSIEAAGNAAAEGIDILSDHFASEEYRKHLAKVYLKRALKAL